MTKILFVCHGNICRSPAAELVLKNLAERAGLAQEFVIGSAATTSEELGNPVYPPMRHLLENRGLDCSSFSARRISRSEYEDWDLIIGMDEENLWDLRRIFHGDPDGKLHLLLEYLGRADEDIPDPWYTRDFSGCLEEVELACAALLEHLEGIVFLDFSSCADIPALFDVLRLQMLWDDWYGENLDALNDILTGLPHRGRRFILTLPAEDAPADVRLYAGRIAKVFLDTGKGVIQ